MAGDSKGKGKARDDGPVGDTQHAGAGSGSGGADSGSALAYSIRFTHAGISDLDELWVGPSESVRSVKQRIRLLRKDQLAAIGSAPPVLDAAADTTATPDDSTAPDEQQQQRRPRRLRLIHLGRLLTDGTLLVPWTRTLLDRRARATDRLDLSAVAIDLAKTTASSTVSTTAVASSDDAAKSSTAPPPPAPAATTEKIWLHCSVGEPMSAHELAQEMGLLSASATASTAQSGTATPRPNLAPRGQGSASGQATPTPAGGGEDTGEPQRQGQGEAQYNDDDDDVDEDELARRRQEGQIRPLQGFDRLRDAGFSEQEIETIRQEFHESHGGRGGGRGAHRGAVGGSGVGTFASGAGVGGVANGTLDDDDEHARALEDQWMDSLGDNSAATQPAGGNLSSFDPFDGAQGVYMTLLRGVCIGFFVPFVPLFFFRTQVFSQRMQVRPAILSSVAMA